MACNTAQCSYVGPRGRCCTPAPRGITQFHLDACDLLGVKPGSRGTLCSEHIKFDVCSAHIEATTPDGNPVCSQNASSFWDSRRSYRPLTFAQCQLGSLDVTLANGINRICMSCRKYLLDLPTRAFRLKRYEAADRVLGTIAYTDSITADDVEWILSEPKEDCPQYISSCFVGKDHRHFIGCFVNGELCSARASPPHTFFCTGADS
jgi:hypothetical protein